MLEAISGQSIDLFDPYGPNAVYDAAACAGQSAKGLALNWAEDLRIPVNALQLQSNLLISPPLSICNVARQRIQSDPCLTLGHLCLK